MGRTVTPVQYGGLNWDGTFVAKTLTPAVRLGCGGPKGKTSALRRAKEHGLFGLPTDADVGSRVTLFWAPQINV
jgi:hypothetical protein